MREMIKMNLKKPSENKDFEDFFNRLLMDYTDKMAEFGDK